jgi:hypothetical protein
MMDNMRVAAEQATMLYEELRWLKTRRARILSGS